MKPTSLLLNNKAFSYNQIKAGEYTVSSPFEKRTLLFCNQWLNGQQVFEQKTSGSTGTPKLIQISRVHMCLSAELTVTALKLSRNDIALVCVDSDYIAGKMMLVRAFEHQMNIVIIEPSASPLGNINTPFHFAAMVPMQIENTLKNSSTKEKLANCKAILIGGAPVNIKLAKQIEKLNIPIYATYGMTETVSHIALQKISAPREEYFRTIGDVTINTNNQGQLIIKGAITDNKELVTNDRITLLSPNTFKWLGRIDNVVNSGGVKFQLEEIEASISLVFNNLNIENVFFVSKNKDESLGDKIVLYIESRDRILPVNFKEVLKKGLAKYQYPKEIILVKKFSTTNSGKIDKLAIIHHQN